MKSFVPAFCDNGSSVNPEFLDLAASILSVHLDAAPAAVRRSVERYVSAMVSDGAGVSKALGDALVLAVENDLDFA